MGEQNVTCLNLEPNDLEILTELASKANKTTEAYIHDLFSDLLNGKIRKINDFEENGVKYERMVLEVPKPLAEYYHIMAHLKGIDNKTETLMLFDLTDYVRSKFDGITPEDAKELFNIGPTIELVAGREQLLLSKE
jgi:hypothetical protein